jgi:hypothetical protein
MNEALNALANDELLPIDAAERVVCWENGEGKQRRHTFRRITPDMWNEYFSKIVIETDRRSELVDFTGAQLWLYVEAATAADGYAVRGGGKLTDLARWQDRIPVGQRKQAVDILCSVSRSASDAIEIEPEIEVVRLDSLWGEDGKGGMKKYSGLIHRLSPPTVDHQQRFSRENSRALVVGGSRDGRTIHAPKQRILVKLYDELVQSVEGYSFKGAPLTDRETVVREMDLFHKVAAVADLFSARAEAAPEEAAA